MTIAAGAAFNVAMTGKNVGNLLNAAGVSWGWFYGDFAPASTNGVVATCIGQYNPHYAPFDYYRSTSNPHHLSPTSIAAIGTDTCANLMCANHNYDLKYFYQALSAGNLPAVTYLKFAENDTGHPSDSTPLEEQVSIVTAVNAIEPFWRDTAIMITYDDSDGWYDHVAGLSLISRRIRSMARFRVPRLTLGGRRSGNRPRREANRELSRFSW